MQNHISVADPAQAPDIVTSALRYAKAGIAVFATTADGKAPSTSNAAWSRRLGREIRKGQGGLHMATTDPDTIRWMFSWKNAGGIGMPCGKVNNVIVADFDIHKEAPGGNAHRRLFEYEDEIEAAHRVRTRNGGLHAYFKYRPGHGKHELGENIEVQTDGSYVLLPPSKGYRVENLVFRDEWFVPPWPPMGNGAALDRQPDEVVDLATWTEEIQRLQQMILEDRGQWHNAMVRLTARLVGIGWSDAQILQHVPQWTGAGYTHWQTFQEVATAIAGARAKWDRRDAPKTTNEARLWRLAEIWNASPPSVRKEFFEMISESEAQQ